MFDPESDAEYECVQDEQHQHERLEMASCLWTWGDNLMPDQWGKWMSHSKEAEDGF